MIVICSISYPNLEMTNMSNDNGYFNDYVEKIKTGEILVSQRLKKYLTRLQKEMNNDTYFYDTHEANRYFRFAETCIKLGEGDYAGEKMVFTLWEKAFFECLLSFKRKKDGKRRFTDALLLIARKNGKTALMSSFAIYNFFLKKGSIILCASNDQKQTSILWNGCEAMRMQFDTKNRISGKNQSEIYSKKLLTHIQKISSTQKNTNGLRSSIVLFDEAHDATDENGGVYISARQSTANMKKTQPLRIITTTQGINRGCFLDIRVKHCHAIMDGELEDDRWLCWLYEQDSEDEVWQDEASWVKSNPSLTQGIKSIEYLHGELNEARLSKSSRLEVLTKDFNLILENSINWLDEKDIFYNQPAFSIEELHKKVESPFITCTVGVDLSRTTDITASVVLIKLPKDPIFYIIPHYWIPKAKYESEADSEAGAKYQEWIKEGRLTVCDDAEIDQLDVEKWLLDISYEQKIKPHKIYIDKWFATQYEKQAQRDFGKSALVEVEQGYNLSNSIYRTEQELKNNNINFQNDAITSWMLSNVSAKFDNDMKIKLTKPKRAGAKIDGVIALVMAMQAYRENMQEIDAWNE